MLSIIYLCICGCHYLILKIKIEYHEKGKYFCHSFQKMKPIYYIDSLHIAWKISSVYFLKRWWLWLTDNEKSKFPSQKIRILHKTKKKGYFKQKCSVSRKDMVTFKYIINMRRRLKTTFPDLRFCHLMNKTNCCSQLTFVESNLSSVAQQKRADYLLY